MASRRSTSNFSGRLVLGIQIWSLFALAQDYAPADMCASINTSDGERTLDIYQSHGACGDLCRGKYAFAIMQNDQCWCSDYAPAQDTIVDDGECDKKCPGYDEWCGGKGLYGYLSLSKKPAGTKGSGGSDGDSTDPSSTVQTVTADGTVKTVTLLPTAGVDSPNTADMTGTSKKGPSTGEIVGIVVGVALGIMLIVGIVCFVKIQRRQQRNQGTFEVRNAGSPGAGISGSLSGMSQTKDGGFLMTRDTTDGAEAGAGNRRSRLMPIDPRMDPDTAPGIYVRNKSHESINTLRDEHDYSRKVHQPRVLRATNPDPDIN